MAGYATLNELKLRWPDLPATASDEQVEALLEDAAVIIDAEAPPPAPPEELTAPQKAARRMVSCAMVKRALSSPGGLGVSSVQQGAGPYQETLQFTNPTGDLYLTRAERRLLGVGQQRAFTVSMLRDSAERNPLEVLP